ncbi:hypothetical protein GGR54DRAFT_406730 [Hypoxylon sp. NC1633]|nr:hypothetical protein GGR54DRAFT_406730 [Hypoxylon sp. NC1633]
MPQHIATVMTHKFTPDSLRKKLKSVRSRFYLSDRARDSRSCDENSDSIVVNVDGPTSPASLNRLSRPPRPNSATSTRENGNQKGFIPIVYREGDSMEGKASNGHANNHSNGHANGHISNGHANGHISNGHANGHISNGGASKGASPKGNDPKGMGSEIVSYDRPWSTTETSTTAGSNFVDAKMVFRSWPDDELAQQRDVVAKYETGAKLWTKEQLAAIEDQIEKQNPITLHGYVGKDEIFERAEGITYMVQFHGYRNLAFPPPQRPNGMPYCSISLKALPFDYSCSRDLQTELDAFHKCTAIWLTNPIGQMFYSMFMRVQLPSYINKIVCFNLGSITSRPANDYVSARHAMYKHAAAMTIVEALHRRFGTVISLFAQDTTYCNKCTQVLYKKGFSIVGMHGAGGFAEIDEHTLVFAPNPAFCLKEIVADIAEPAAMLWNTVVSTEEYEKNDRSYRPVVLDDELTCHYELRQSDTDTPRVRALVDKYDRQTFPLTNLLGPVSLYTRKGTYAPKEAVPTAASTVAA